MRGTCDNARPLAATVRPASGADVVPLLSRNQLRAGRVIVYMGMGHQFRVARTAPGKERENAVNHAVLERRTLARDPGLTEEEIRLLSHLASGMTADVAARRLDLSSRTLRRRVRSICDRLDVSTPIQAVVWAAKRGLV